MMRGASTEYPLDPKVLLKGPPGRKPESSKKLPPHNAPHDTQSPLSPKSERSRVERSRNTISFGKDAHLSFDNTEKASSLKSGLKSGLKKKKKDAAGTAGKKEVKRVNDDFEVPKVGVEVAGKMNSKNEKNAGISFASYSAADEEEGGEEEGRRRARFEEMEERMEGRMEMMESGLEEVRRRATAPLPSTTSTIHAALPATLPPPSSPPFTASPPFTVTSSDLDSSFLAGFAAGGSGRKPDAWSNLVVLSHFLLAAATVLRLLAVISETVWLGAFLLFVCVTLAKLCATFNPVDVRVEMRVERGRRRRKEVSLEVQAGEATVEAPEEKV